MICNQYKVKDALAVNSSLNIPTDNPYKLMAIIGAIAVVFSVYFLLSQNYRYNELAFSSLEKISYIAEQSDLSEETKKYRISIENKKLEIIKTDREWFPYLCGAMAALGGYLCGIGFKHWIYEVYPDEQAIRKQYLYSLRLANRTTSKTRFMKKS
ncbi:hypothetical protein C7R88_03590 [Plesiomonas shigelloides]|nr:hypothetical protein C7R88_03590 [Plesiomonas shigelloides]